MLSSLSLTAQNWTVENWNRIGLGHDALVSTTSVFATSPLSDNLTLQGFGLVSTNRFAEAHVSVGT